MTTNSAIKKYKRSLCLQKDKSDCGVACLLSIINFYQGQETLENLRNLSGTTSQGTTLLGLYEAAKQIGFDAEAFEADIPSIIGLNNPAILLITTAEKTHHYVLLYGCQKQKLIIGDPFTGISLWTKNQLEQVWESKACLILIPNNCFKTIKQGSKAKRQWLIELIKADSAVLITSTIIGVLVSIMNLVMAIFTQKLIDKILPKKEFAIFYSGIILVILLLLAKEFLSIIRQNLLLNQAAQFNQRINKYFFTTILNLPKIFFDSRKIGDLTARLNDTARIQKAISQIIGSTIIDLFITIVTLLFLFSYSLKIGLMCIAVLPFYFIILFWNNRRIVKRQRAVMISYAMKEANYISTLLGIEPIKNHSKQLFFSNLNQNYFQKYQDNVFQLGKIQLRLSFFVNIFSIFFLTGILSYCSYQVMHETLRIGQLIAILSMITAILPSVAGLALASLPISEAGIALDRMYEYTKIIHEDTSNELSFNSIESLQLKELSFHYPGRKQLLRDVTLHVNKGEIIAIMGENGSGKTTLVRILQRFNIPETGQIILNYKFTAELIPIQTWRNIIGIVPQHVHLFNGTVLENICFDDAHGQPSLLIDFLHKYGFSQFINSLPQSFMTLIGEEGIKLSGGQTQIIGLARALYHKPKLLILDEATSAMDRHSETFTLHLLEKLKKEMGIICITHRLHILKSHCDRIYILENGIITFQGSHFELLESDNLYSEYWRNLTS